MLAALSAGTKTYFIWKSWIPRLRWRKEDLGLGVKDVYYESKMKYEYQQLYKC